MPKPNEVIVRMYNVGFGDCFLITFAYARALPDGRDVRHMLVDFGSTGGPKAGPTFKQVAESIEATTGGKLDVVVATHRHKDHISGFGIKETKAVMDRLDPQLVIRPWTDDPKAPRDAKKRHRLDAASREFLRVLDSRDTWLKGLATSAAKDPKRGAEVLEAVDDQMPNLTAIDRLDDWCQGGRGLHVCAGDSVELEEVIPGVSLDILGPPTLKQAPGLASEAFTHKEFWAVDHAAVLGPLQGNKKLADAYKQLAAPDGCGEAAWILKRLSSGDIDLLFNVVRLFDDALNNTSVIMLLRAGSRSLLLSGDAQIENWEHCLNLTKERNAAGRSLRSKLADVDLYKVGHHGSRNATPRSLYAMWDRPGRRPAVPRMVTMMSTLPGKHGETKDTAVPKGSLVDALEAVSKLYRTDTLTKTKPFIEVRAHATGDHKFEPV